MVDDTLSVSRTPRVVECDDCYASGYNDGESSVQADLICFLEEECGMPDGESPYEWMRQRFQTLDDLENMVSSMRRLGELL